MANFKIKLLTSRLNTTNGVVNFIETPISEFYDQQEVYKNQNKKWSERQHVYCYSFNEKVSFHSNGQKELSFSMMRNVWLNGEQTLNPFVSQLKNGSQILLIDQYENEYFFTIKDIKYNVKQSNITYDYSCQDSFTYQHIRQNGGYTISNDSSDSSFIGARSVDWWVQEKIQPDCHIAYQYLPLATGLYLSEQTDNLVVFSETSKLTDVKKVVKPAFTTSEYKEYHETIPFSVSGSNASAALIALGEELGLVLNFKEHNLRDSSKNRTNSFVRYFWFEPKQNEKTADLKYSPYTTIQSFNFSHGGSSLTTVLNVESNTFNDEIVSMLPAIPPFFSALFSSESWKSTLFTDGFFTAICQKQNFLCKNGLGGNNDFRYSLDIKPIAQWDGDGSWYGVEGEEGKRKAYIYFQLKNNPNGFTIPEHYNKVALFDGEDSSKISLNGEYYSGKTSQWEFVICDFERDGSAFKMKSGYPIVYNDTYSQLPNELLGETPISTVTWKNSENQDETKKIPACYLRLRIPTGQGSNAPAIEQSNVLLHFYRDATEEELEFAEIADQCPWLENKLFDFNYFVQHQIISPEECGSLTNLLKNNLRIVNGQLLYYSKEYYQALQTKTTELAKLTSTLDSLGAAFSSDVVETFKTTGSVGDIDYFNKAYSTLQAKYFKGDEPTPIINYKELLTEYFNKYFSAQQRFLKNIYNFRKFFNQKIHWKGDVKLYNNTLTLRSLGSDQTTTSAVSLNNSGVQYDFSTPNTIVKRYISFSDYISFTQISSSFNLYDGETLKPYLKLYEADKITEASIVDKTNCTSFYKAQIEEQDIIRCDFESKYNGGQIYYKVVYEANLKDGDIDIEWPEKTSTLIKYKTDETKVWYCYIASVASMGTENSSWPLEESITIGEKTYKLTKTFVAVTYNEIVNEYLYKIFSGDIKFDQDDNIADGNTSNPINPKESYVYHNKNTQKPTSDWWSKDTITQNLSIFKPAVFANTLGGKDWEKNLFPKLEKQIDKCCKNADKGSNPSEEMADFYVTHFPITTVSYIGPGYKHAEWKWRSQTLEYQPVNKKGNTLTEYIDYLKKTIIYEEKGVKEVKNPLSTTEYTTKTIPMVTPDNESEYYRRIPKGGAIALSTAAIALGTIVGFALIGPVVGLTIAALSTYALTHSLWRMDTKWETKGINTQNFSGEAFDDEITYTGYHDLDDFYYTKSSSSYSDWYAINEQRKLGSDEPLEIKLTQTRDDSFTLWKTFSHSEKTYYLQYTAHEDLEDYFDFYSKIGLTYQKARNFIPTGDGENPRQKQLTFTDSYLRPVTNINEHINHKGKYYLLSTTNESGQNLTFTAEKSIKDIIPENKNKFSKVLYYFLFNNCSEIDMMDLDGKTTWNEVMDGAANTFDSSTYEFKITNSDSRKFIILQLEDYLEEQVYDSSKRFDLYTGEPIYNNAKGNAVIDFSKIEGLVEGFYQHATESSGFIPIGSVDDIVWDGDNKTKLYRKNELNEYERVYTVLQAKEMENYFYVKNEIYTEESINPKSIFDLNVYLHQEYYNIQEDNTLALNTEIDKTFIKKVQYSFDFSTEVSISKKTYSSDLTITISNSSNHSVNVYTNLLNIDNLAGEVLGGSKLDYIINDIATVLTSNADAYVWYIDPRTSMKNIIYLKDLIATIPSVQATVNIQIEDENKIYSRNCSLQREILLPISNLTNGDFWQLYHTRTDHPLLFEEAATIETELTQYWQIAYNASLYCEYFLPSSWQPRIDGDTNYFNKGIIIVKKDNTTALSNRYLPEVEIYQENNTIKFPVYELEYGNGENASYSPGHVNQNLNLVNYIPTRQLANFKPLKDAINELGEDINNFVVVDYSGSDNSIYKKNYYYSTNPNSGTKWKDFIQLHSNITSIYALYSGLYVMTYNVLKNQFKDRTSERYSYYKEQQNTIWNNLYKQFPGVLLEESYSNKNATSPRELFKLASTAFGDKREPERGYSISLINPTQDLLVKEGNKQTYKRYAGQELKVGEGILVNADDYYDEYDDVYKTLSQYLFISDISYDLRKDSDIQVTVNTIKYQDKLIQRLVKLIK